ncbi:uncharacterized protein LOC135076622 [Ostrinia nubilalis]|uniref:uncharacterized protein LOC135076622 n=1 Tax=Ostrinia nubilalis TaxID=29057 RepID=UPI0030823CB0
MVFSIVFTDGSKRTCTGAIIHDNVVITAAHCFCKKGDSSTKPELTTSFVVIGTKKMFDTGYEQYLPIERILTHPKFRGWTADLSLVYTFAAMTSDKPGKIIPLAGEKMSNPVDSNVTVFSWGHCKDEDNSLLTTTAPCPEDSAEDMNDQEPVRVTAGLNSKRSRAQEKTQPPQNQPEQKKQYPAPKQNLRQPLRYKTEPKKTQQSRYKTESRTVQKDLFHQYPILQQKVRNKQIDDRLVEPKKEATAKRLSRYLTSSEDNVEGAEKHIRGRLVTRPSSEPIDSIKTMYKNWRRVMDSLV